MGVNKVENKELIRGFYNRIGIALFVVFFLLLAFPASGEAASKLEQFPAAKEAGQPGQLLWKLSGLGKLSTDIIFAPNATCFFPLTIN